MRLPLWLASLALGIAMWLLGSGSAQAQFGNCSISTTSVSFGVYDVFASSPLDSTGNIHLTCFGWLRTVSVWLSRGNGPGVSNRQMVNQDPTWGGSRLAYNLYLDAARRQIWGDPSPYSYSTQMRFFFIDLSVNIYGRIDAGQDVPAGTYTDTVSASINF